MKNLKTTILTIITSLILFSCKDNTSDATEGTLTIKLDHTTTIGETLTDGAGNDFTLTKLRYIITDVTLVDDNGNELLLDNEDAAKMIDLSNADNEGIVLAEIDNVDTTTFSSLKFNIGVSEDTYALGQDQQGVLYDLALETDTDGASMFWAWASGYIYLKIEGEYLSNQSTTTNDHTEHTEEDHSTHTHNSTNNLKTASYEAFQYHVGNTGVDDNRTDRVMEVNVSFHGENITIEGADASVHLEIDVEKILSSTVNVDVTTANGHTSTVSDDISENVENGVFSFSHQH